VVVPLRRNRDFVALWVGQAVSSLGISISSFGYPVVVLAETGSAVRAGLVGSVLAGTAFVFRLPAGVLVDRWNRRAILVCCDLGRVLNAGAFALMLALGHFVFAQVLVVAFFEAALGVLFGPAESAAVRNVVAPEQIREAVAVNASRGSFAGVLGPPVGGLLISLSRALPFAADALSYLVSLVCIVSVKGRLQAERKSSTPPRRLGEVLDGLRFIRAHLFLRAALLVFMAFGLILGSIGLVILVLARNHGATAGEIGVMFAISASGGLVGGLLTSRLVQRVRPFTLFAIFVWSTTGAIFALTVLDAPVAYGLAGAVPFFFVPPLNAVVFGLIAEQAPDELQGRVVSAAIQIGSLLAPAGPLVAGALVAAAGASRAVVVYGCAVALFACAATASRGLRSYDPRQPAA
jgi:MFS family permease